MAIPVILKGDTSRAIPLALSADFDYSGCRLYADFCDIRHTFVDFGASDALELRFGANSTSRMPLGTSKVFLTLVNGAGEEMQLPWAKIKVTDSPSEVRAASIAVDPGTLDVDELPTRFTDADVKARIDAIIRWLRRSVPLLLASACCSVFASSPLTVHTATKGTIYNDEPVVTNVTFDADALAFASNTYTKAETDAKIVELAPAPGDYANVSNRAMTALQSHQSLAPATNYTDSATNALAAVVDGKVSATNESGTAYIGWDGDIFHFSYGIQVDYSPVMLPPSLDGIYFGEQSLLDILDERALAATNYTDASISTNNAAFVAAVTNCPVVIAAASAESIGEWGAYGTLGALLAALAAGLANLKSNKADKAELPYEIHAVTVTSGAGTLADRAVNTVSVSADATLTLPAAVVVGGVSKVRDLLVDLTVSGTPLPDVDFAAATGETVTFVAEGDPSSAEFAVPSAAGEWLYSFTEVAAGKFAVALKQVSAVSQGGAS